MTEGEAGMSRRPFPMRPCPAEKIILCIDSCEERLPRYQTNQVGKQPSTLSTIKKCAETFLLSKSTMNPKHLFAIMVLKSQNQVFHNFSNKVPELIKQINCIVPGVPPEQSYPLSCIFQFVYELVFKDLDEDEDGHLIPLRIVLFYGRPGSCSMEENVLIDYKNVITDVLFIHRPIMSAKEKKRLSANLQELQSCLSEKSLCAVAQADSLHALQHTMKFLKHPNLR